MIVAVNGERIANARELARRIGSMAPGNTVKLTVLQGGSEKTVSVTLGELPTQAEASRRGGERGARRASERFRQRLACNSRRLRP